MCCCNLDAKLGTGQKIQIIVNPVKGQKTWRGHVATNGICVHAVAAAPLPPLLLRLFHLCCCARQHTHPCDTPEPPPLAHGVHVVWEALEGGMHHVRFHTVPAATGWVGWGGALEAG